MEQTVDLIVTAGELATPQGAGPRAGAAMNEIQVLEDAGAAVSDGRIVAVARSSELRKRWPQAREVSAPEGTLVPGFVDAHTHPVFAGTREDEFELRTRGASYVEIAAAGGGILSSVRGVRESSSEELLARLLLRLDRFLELGTTTVETKTGYGLTAADEDKCLAVIASARRTHAVEVVATFLGAHDFPPEFRDDRAGYVQLVTEEMLPRVAEGGVAEYCDIFTESHVFGLEDSRLILTRASELGLGLRLHVDQLTPLGGAELASELGAASADHLEFVSRAGIEALGRSQVMPVLCPLVPLYLRQEQEAPGRAMIDAGLPVALATDFNPGSCNTQSMPEVLTWAALRLRMSAAECLTAGTLNAACSVGRGERLGSIEVGKDADLVLVDLPSHKHLCYEFGRNPVQSVVKRGVVAYERS